MTFLFFVIFSWFVVKAKTQRQVLALALAGTTAAVLVAPPRVQAQSSLVGAIQAVLNVINGIIHTGLTSINSVRTAINSLYQNVVWPVQLINLARATGYADDCAVSELDVGHPQNQRGERDASPNPAVGAGHKRPANERLCPSDDKLWECLRPSTGFDRGEPPDRAMTDMDDAMALDTLKTLKKTDEAGTLALQAGDQLEGGAGEAAPGSSPFLTASCGGSQHPVPSPDAEDACR